MKSRHADRTRDGFKSEDNTARGLRSKGHSVSSVARNTRGHDLKVDGKKVEVKAAVETSYKGSDGHPIKGFVFSNMKKNPSAEKYILKCMSPDRSKTLKEYHVPAGKVKQKTLTITRDGKYEGFKKKAAHKMEDVRGIGKHKGFANAWDEAEGIDLMRLSSRILGGGLIKVVRQSRSVGKLDFSTLTRPTPGAKNMLINRAYGDTGEWLLGRRRTKGALSILFGPSS